MKQLRGIKVLSWLELITGLAGTIVLLFVFFSSLAALFFAKGEARMGFMALFSTPALLPFPILAIAGMSLLKRRVWAPLFHTAFYSLVIAAGIIRGANLILHNRQSIHEIDNSSALFLIAAYLLISVAVLIFLNRPAVRKQYRSKTSSTA